MEFTKRFHQFGSFASNIVNNTKNVQMPQNPGQVFCIGAGLLGTVVIKVTKKKKTFVHPHDEYEHALERMKSAESRIEAVSSLLKEMTNECNETKEELSIVVSQKNAIERMLEELEKAKEQAERASRELQKSVNVLTSELETNKERHVEKVKQWRNEIVSYREKSHENFLAEIIGLVSDMDNDIQIEVVPHMLPHERAEVHLKEGESEWEHNPRFALEDSARLSILANCGKSAKETKQVKAEKILSHATKKVESPAHVKKVATPTRKAFARITNNQVTQNITEKIITKTASMKPKPPPPAKKNMLSSSPDAKISNKEFGEMLYFDFENNNNVSDNKASVGKLAGAKAKFMAKWNSSKAGAVAETAFGVSDVKRAFKINGQFEEIEYVSPSRRTDLSVVR
jgi:chaperonin cofactor prefoldin